jgi:hypothetical protein
MSLLPLLLLVVIIMILLELILYTNLLSPYSPPPYPHSHPSPYSS